VQCLPQIRTSSGVLALPNVSPPDGLVTCDRVTAFLSSDPAGMAYAREQGGIKRALQNFVVAGQHGDAQRAVFMVVLIAVLFGCINGAREFVKEVAIYRRERAVNLGILPYLFSKVLVFSLLALVQSATLVLIVNAFEPLRQGVFLPVLLESYLTLAITSIAGVMLGLLISAIAPNEDTANSLLPLVVILQVTFSGDIVPLKDAATKIGAMIFPIRWGMAAFGSSLGLHSDKINGDQLFGDDYLYHGTLFSTYSQDDAAQRILLCWLALGAISVVLGCLIVLALKRKDVRR
jgi:ABC-type multidrug transport system permease subunit